MPTPKYTAQSILKVQHDWASTTEGSALSGSPHATTTATTEYVTVNLAVPVDAHFGNHIVLSIAVVARTKCKHRCLLRGQELCNRSITPRPGPARNPRQGLTGAHERSKRIDTASCSPSANLKRQDTPLPSLPRL
ncbi:hypothetical protein H9L39_10691 [Fusarium oxysporum f. sp. albedinis]|nr:hypothetical protein H9L39_10691 [Fusarium oxysporum f. sp. albedinis]